MKNRWYFFEISLLTFLLFLSIFVSANEETVRQIKEAEGEAFAYQIDLTSKRAIAKTARMVQTEVGKVNSRTITSTPNT